MRRVGVAVVVAAVVLLASACGSGRHTTFSTSYQACALSVPAPTGFHHRFWGANGGGGVEISDGRIPPGDPTNRFPGTPPENQNQVTLFVDSGAFHAAIPQLPSSVSLHDLEQASGGLTLWGGGFQVGHEQCAIGVWLGPKASAADRSDVLNALGGIKQLPGAG
jgi:hypothetical protein